ncbi:MAG: hypothetical protein AB1489_24485 [Acidobacteriota bacterium]
MNKEPASAENNAVEQTETNNCCAICQRIAQDYYQHWACLKYLVICRLCYANLRLIQCTSCKGVGTSFDITVCNHISSAARLCPSCREKIARPVAATAFASSCS